MLKKYQDFKTKINEEVGIRNITKIVQDHLDTGSNNFEIWFHQDLDGVTSALAMKKYLERYGLKLVDAHIIQYGGLEYAIKNKRPDSMAVLVDYAHFRTLFTIGTDHHSGQAGEVSGASHAKPTRSNVETISGEISNSDIFTAGDIKLIQTVDSADFLRQGITPEDIQNSIFSVKPTLSGEKNRFMMGFVVNRLLLVYKTKRISVKSLDGKRDHINKNLLECLVLDSTPSLVSMYLNLKHYMNSAVSLEWDRSKREHNVPKRLASPEEINANLQKYITSRKSSSDVNFDPEYKIVTQYGIGSVFEPGAYDRYVVFKNNPEAEFVCTIFPMGLIQVSCNPFKEKRLKMIDLGEITKEVLSKYKYQLSNINIPINEIKRISESEIEGMRKKYGPDYQGVGFTYEDLKMFYDKDIIFLGSDNKTRLNLDLNNPGEYKSIADNIKRCMQTPYENWSREDKKEMEKYKIPVLRIIEQMSGGHPSITNIQGLNYLASRKDLLLRLFKTEDWLQVMKLLANEFVNILKQKIDLAKTGKEVVYDTGDLKLAGDISESFEYYVEINNKVKPVSKDEFIQFGSDSKFAKTKDGKGFSMDVKDNKVIGKYNK